MFIYMRDLHSPLTEIVEIPSPDGATSATTADSHVRCDLSLIDPKHVTVALIDWPAQAVHIQLILTQGTGVRGRC